MMWSRCHYVEENCVGAVYCCDMYWSIGLSCAFCERKPPYSMKPAIVTYDKRDTPARESNDGK